jgi:HSP20 family molecular chaperone IbpA
VRYRRIRSRNLASLQALASGDLVWARTTNVIVGPLAWEPPADVCETADGISVWVELAGADEADVEIDLYPDALVIEGVRQPAACPVGGVYHRAEIRPGPFHLLIGLPSPVDVEAARARYDRGILSIELPKTAADQAAREVAGEGAGTSTEPGAGATRW